MLSEQVRNAIKNEGPRTNNADALANGVAKLERVARAAEKQRGTLRKTRHYSELTEIEIEIFEALKEAEGLF